jgi:hypothetical protein
MSTGRPVLSPDGAPSSTVHPHVTHRACGCCAPIARTTALPSCPGDVAAPLGRGRTSIARPPFDGVKAGGLIVPLPRRHQPAETVTVVAGARPVCRVAGSALLAGRYGAAAPGRYDDVSSAVTIRGKVASSDCPLWTVVPVRWMSAESRHTAWLLDCDPCSPVLSTVSLYIVDVWCLYSSRVGESMPNTPGDRVGVRYTARLSTLPMSWICR